MNRNTAKLTDPIWDSRNDDEPLMSTQLPGEQKTETPPLPGDGAPQPNPGYVAAVEGMWANLARAPKSLAELILFVNSHPELADWARSAVNAGVVHITRPEE